MGVRGRWEQVSGRNKKKLNSCYDINKCFGILDTGYFFIILKGFRQICMISDIHTGLSVSVCACVCLHVCMYSNCLHMSYLNENKKCNNVNISEMMRASKNVWESFVDFDICHRMAHCINCIR